MTRVAFIRHGPTEWNETHRVQGRTDIPLSPRGRAKVAGWRLPPEIEGFRWISSPLVRAVETARVLSGAAPALDDRLQEMSWGEWEGMRLVDLRAELGDLMVAWEADGLDFRAPGGESPRQVQVRLGEFLAELAADGRPTVAVCHKGVLRAIYALAVGWDMTGEAPHKMQESCAQLFTLDADGGPTIERLNVSLEKS